MGDIVTGEPYCIRCGRPHNELDTTGPYRHRYVTEWIADD